MTANESLLTLNAAQVEQRARCSETSGRRGKTPRAALDRWLATVDGIEEALRRDDVEAAVLDFTRFFDPVQAQIVANDIRTGFRLLAPDRPRLTFDLDEPDSTLVFDGPNALVNARRTAAIQTDRETEYVKIRTGKRPTSPTEAAILIAGGAPTDRYSDLMLRDETFEDITLDAAELEDQLTTIRRSVQKPATTRNGGYWCYLCDRYAACGHYPTSDTRPVTYRNRSILLAVGDLTTLTQCPRRVAWKRLFAIPEDAEDEPSQAQNLGITFHELIAAAITTDDPHTAFETGLAAVAPSEHASLRFLFDRHMQISETHPTIAYRLAEYQTGITEVVEGMGVDASGESVPGQAVYVTLITRPDAVGREEGDVPVAVDHKTGRSAGNVDRIEMDAYAVTTARVTHEEPVVVRFHALGLPEGPKVHRCEYHSDDIEEALTRLRELMTSYASIDPVDASQSPPTPGRWCSHCVFASRCDAANSASGPSAPQ
jgi:hypothetical protein